MVLLPRDVSEEQLVSIVWHWVDALARGDYEAVHAALGYGLAFGAPGAECIRREIQSYRSETYYPGISEFVVTDWRLARGGNPSPLKAIRWYKAEGNGLRATVELDLPLNGHWSDLEADFVLFEARSPDEGYVLGLEEIGSAAQRQREDDVR